MLLCRPYRTYIQQACRALGMWIKGQSMCQLRGGLVPLLELAQEQVRSAAAGGVARWAAY